MAGLRKWEAVIILAGILLAAYAAAGVLAGVRVMDQQDRLVMEEFLAGEGYQVRVESGTLVQAGGEVWACLHVKLPSGDVRELRYNLGSAREGREYVRGVR
jgi:hypothetical protein